MSDRKYSVEEIDQMRAAVWHLTMIPMQVYSAGQLDQQVESRLRTFMQNGTDPEELEAAVQKKFAARSKQHA